MKQILLKSAQLLPHLQNKDQSSKPPTTPILWKVINVLQVSVIAASVITLFVTHPISQLPEPGEAGPLLGNLMSAQAAIAALTLAVSLFVMQGTKTKEDFNDRMYREYLRRSWVVHIFWHSLIAVAVTGSVLLTETTLSESHPTTGLRNLTVTAFVAFLANLAFAGALFGRAVHLAYPRQWRSISRDLNKCDVLAATQVFLRRYKRAIASLEANAPDMTSAFPDPEEGSADEAIRALLDDARRAMAERRHSDFETCLNSIQELVTYAMDELESRGHSWLHPGSQPEWPPLRELGSNLYPFREDILRHGGREYLFELLKFDYWMTSTGMGRDCGELFSVGLDGQRRNYHISNRTGSVESQEMVRTLGQAAGSLTFSTEPQKDFPFMREIVRHQESMLSDAMHADRPDDFESLHRGFEETLRDVRWHWDDSEKTSPSESAELHETLEKDYRIVLMGLAGRAALLNESSRVTDMSPYLDAARRAYDEPGLLTDDLAQALRRDRRSGFSQWHDWEWEGAENEGVRSIFPDQYPIAFFTIRLMELVTDPITALDLHGNAKKVLDWFTDNSERVEHNVPTGPNPTMERRRELAMETLTAAVRNDEVNEDHEIINRALSTERVSSFISEVYAAAFATNSVERLFERSGAFLYLSSDSEGQPRDRGTKELVPKIFLSEAPENARTFSFPLKGDQRGISLSNDVIRLLCEVLDDAPETKALLDGPKEFLQAIDKAKDELNPSSGIAIVLAGDWSDMQLALSRELPDGYEPGYRLREDHQIGEMARYRGHPILRGLRTGDRRLYVVEPSTWGCLIRAQIENNQDLRVEVKPISVEQARELSDANPTYFADEPDEESKIRKLQTFVGIVIGARIRFHKTDGSRARRITSAR